MTAKIDASTSALLVLHYQNGIVKPEGVFAFSGTAAQVEKHGCLAKTAAVLAAARGAGIPVIYVNIAYRPGFPELKKPTYPLIESIQERNAFLRGSWDAAVPDEIAMQPEDIEVINFDSSGVLPHRPGLHPPRQGRQDALPRRDRDELGGRSRRRGTAPSSATTSRC